MPDAWIEPFVVQQGLPPGFRATAERVVAPLADWIIREAGGKRPFVLGLAGAQGSGKSTLSLALQAALDARGRATAILSIDDLYLGRSARLSLAERVHPLFRTRGPPGTHDVALGLALFSALGRAGDVPLPRFSKADDEPAPRAQWPSCPAPPDVVILEGWCVGARPQPAAALSAPVNSLEALEDADRRWRTYANDQLAGPYAELFARADRLIYLRPPSFDVVARWRGDQERQLRDRLASEGRPAMATLADDQIPRFVAHYERVTRAMMADLPSFAALTLQLDDQREVTDWRRSGR
jgi:D-glycerate 3-kinase